jgi:hypothetical protein
MKKIIIDFKNRCVIVDGETCNFCEAGIEECKNEKDFFENDYDNFIREEQKNFGVTEELEFVFLNQIKEKKMTHEKKIEILERAHDALLDVLDDLCDDRFREAFNLLGMLIGEEREMLDCEEPEE